MTFMMGVKHMLMLNVRVSPYQLLFYDLLQEPTSSAISDDNSKQRLVKMFPNIRSGVRVIASVD